jgi:hypothetical protein
MAELEPIEELELLYTSNTENRASVASVPVSEANAAEVQHAVPLALAATHANANANANVRTFISCFSSALFIYINSYLYFIYGMLTAIQRSTTRDLES